MLFRVALAVVLLGLGSVSAFADGGVCHVVDVQLQPQKRMDLRPGKQLPPQIVIWVEDAAGNFIDTVFITQQTGTYGLGNRPGRMDFNSAPLWPYGKRITTFPVWAEKKPERFDSIVFQDGAENNLSHRVQESSLDPHYCRPMQPTGPDGIKFDAMTCASPTTTHTDKGVRSLVKSKYPPRQDMARATEDAPDLDTFPDMNPYDTVSGATPPVGELAMFNWPIGGRPPGDYVMWVEASTEFDHNATYTVGARPSPMVSYSEYGEAYRGQPSIVFRVPFSITGEERIAQTTAYFGYGDPDGEDGVIREPDATISNTLVGSGLQRLAIVHDADGDFRVRVTTRPELDVVAPNAPSELLAAVLQPRNMTLSFVAPGDDAVMGTVRGYEIRYRVGRGNGVTAENFDAPDSIVVPSSIAPEQAGTVHEIELTGLLPETAYSIGIRAYDDCQSKSAVGTLAFTTPERTTGEVDACFIASAAYGSALAADVAMLRGVRDSLLRKTVLGELFVQAYYTFGPPVAGVVGESELLRATARAALGPVVNFARRHRSSFRAPR